ncbi:MAG: hypothetical protein OXR66_09590 [Candidatus Woesearchaeota archaeon]|nr:hypothetical protein [Candidatus Woesearchaeota archaeon]
MANALVSIRFAHTLLSDAQHITEVDGFSSVQEFIRHAVREAVRERKLQDDVHVLKTLRGSVKDTKLMTREERDAFARKAFPPQGE